MQRPPLVFAVVLGTSASTLFGWPRAAAAEAPSPELMARLSAYGAEFAALRSRGSVTIDGRFEVDNGSGKVESVKTMTVRAEGQGQGHALHFDVLRYTEDGVDKTQEVKAKSRQSAKDARSGRPGSTRDRHGLSIPILPDQLPRYRFDVVEIDRADPARVRIAFTPKVRADDTIDGSAWVDSRTGALISAAFRLDSTPTFVDFVHVIVQFGASTPLGPAISNVRVEGQGGFLFFRKSFHAAATFSNYQVAAAGS